MKKARGLWYQGVEAFREGRYEEARVAFDECYRLMPKSDVLRNLSISELQSGHYLSAARHLRQLIATPGELPEKVREEAQTRLTQAEAQVGQLALTVDVREAEVSIDQQVIGRSPFAETWYVEPGQHEVSIAKPGYPTEVRQIFALAGVTIPLDVSLEELRRERANEEEAARLMGTSEGQVLAGREGGGPSTGATVALVAGGVLSAAALTGGILFSLSADDHGDKADAEKKRFYGTNACASDSPLSAECAPLRRELEDQRTNKQAAIISFVGFGVVSAATLGYASWLIWGNDSQPSDSPALTPTASVGPAGGILGARGRF